MICSFNTCHAQDTLQRAKKLHGGLFLTQRLLRSSIALTMTWIVHCGDQQNAVIVTNDVAIVVGSHIR